MFKWLFREFPSYADRIHEPSTLFLTVFGNLLIAVSFVVIGLMCTYYAGKPAVPPKSKQAQAVTRLFGYFLIACAMSRAVDTICLWYNYANLAASVRILTGLLAISAILYIPAVVRQTYKTLEDEDLKKKMDETRTRIDKLESLTKKLDESNGTTSNTNE